MACPYVKRMQLWPLMMEKALLSRTKLFQPILNSFMVPRLFDRTLQVVLALYWSTYSGTDLFSLHPSVQG